MLLGHRETHCVCEALSQRTCRDFDAGMMDLRMSWTEGIWATGVVALELLQSHVHISRVMHENVLQETRMSVGKNEAVSVEPARVPR